MPPVGFEPTISVLERAKTVRALDRAATAFGRGYKVEENLYLGLGEEKILNATGLECDLAA
jgi:hypothetical protein